MSRVWTFPSMAGSKCADSAHLLRRSLSRLAIVLDPTGPKHHGPRNYIVRGPWPRRSMAPQAGRIWALGGEGLAGVKANVRLTWSRLFRRSGAADCWPCSFYCTIRIALPYRPCFNSLLPFQCFYHVFVVIHFITMPLYSVFVPSPFRGRCKFYLTAHPRCALELVISGEQLYICRYMIPPETPVHTSASSWSIRVFAGLRNHASPFFPNIRTEIMRRVATMNSRVSRSARIYSAALCST